MGFQHYIVSFIISCVCFAKCAEISLRGKEYIKFDLLGTNTSIYGTRDTLSLRFKTFEPHGLLFYAHGVTGYVTLELYHCKLRYTINMAQEFSVVFGDKLCDNEWHSVVITRDKQKLAIHLDKEPPKLVQIKMLKKFDAQETLRIDIRIYVGGTWKTTNERKTKIVKNFAGCIGDVLFNSYHLISEAQKKSKGYTVAGTLSYTCPAREYKPIRFIDKYSYLKFPSPDRNKVSVQFKFRTYAKNGLLMYRDGSKISVYLYLEDGKLKFEFYIPGGTKEPVILNTDEWLHGIDFNDGEWHSVESSFEATTMLFHVDNTSPVNADAHTKLLGSSNDWHFENDTHVGGGTYYKRMYGFVGCMKDLRVNGAKVNLDKLPKGTTAVNVVMGRCDLTSYCHPTPCQYKSKCEQLSGNFTCRCKRFYSGRYCEVPSFQTTCQGYKDLGVTEDSYCRLDSDQKGSLKEFRVLCNMTNPKEAVTIVNHTSSSRHVKIAEEAERLIYASKSWAHVLDYGVDIKSLMAMIDESDHCRQYVEFNCINTKFLTPRGNDLPGAYWVSDDGVERHYWGGAERGAKTCACGAVDSCHDRTKKCNCDTGDGVWRQDSGYLTNKAHLPVVGLFFPWSAGSSNFTVGPLECFGRKVTLTRETEEQNFFDVACQPLVTQPPPVFPWQLTTTATPKPWSQKTTQTLNITSSSNVVNQSTSAHPITENLFNDTNLTDANVTQSRNIFENNRSNNQPTSIPTTRDTAKHDTNSFIHTAKHDTNSFIPGKLATDRVVVAVAEVKTRKIKSEGDWWFILIVTASSFLSIVAFVFILLVFRHKRKNGVWFKGLFSVFKSRAPLPTIEIYRHSLATETPDILHIEDFKNTKVVDLDLHRGHFIAKKDRAKKKKSVTFKDRC